MKSRGLRLRLLESILKKFGAGKRMLHIEAMKTTSSSRRPLILKPKTSRAVSRLYEAKNVSETWRGGQDPSLNYGRLDCKVFRGVAMVNCFDLVA
ncbi:hypothetical protein AK812_SmicGene20474 [Symbiodinium microadriaticum]|uniref:Uncharacterized protein n=1 Tax=Symbiodinium microadriaticum TaxID=2951 RepID=A0A1Q9DPY4_SYMMI|nr:hypothetical protein AK812_SmicGene20474 [Symbiodinium microadriaticum]